MCTRTNGRVFVIGLRRRRRPCPPGTSQRLNLHGRRPACTASASSWLLGARRAPQIEGPARCPRPGRRNSMATCASLDPATMECAQVGGGRACAWKSGQAQHRPMASTPMGGAPPSGGWPATWASRAAGGRARTASTTSSPAKFRRHRHRHHPGSGWPKGPHRPALGPFGIRLTREIFKLRAG